MSSERHIVFPAYLKGDRDEIDTIEQMFIAVWASLKGTRTEAINRAFLVGLNTLADKTEFEGEADRVRFAVYRKALEVGAGSAHLKRLEFLYEKMSLDNFLSFCQEVGVDGEDFIRQYRVDLPVKKTWTTGAAKWLEEYLSNGEPRPIVEVKKAAEEAGVVSTPSDWNSFKVLASREGYSGSARRGLWKKPDRK